MMDLLLCGKKPNQNRLPLPASVTREFSAGIMKNRRSIALSSIVEIPETINDIESWPMGFLVADGSGGVTAANHIARELLGWSESSTEPLPKPLPEFIAALEHSGKARGHRAGVSFSIDYDRWLEAWICADSILAGGSRNYRVVLRAIDQQRRQYFESYARLRQLMLIGEITAALNSTLGLQETFNVILVGVTAGQGLAFNRAFLFLADEADNDRLVGRTAIGPAGPVQAGKIWDALSRPGSGGLLDAVCTYHLALDGDDAEVNRRVRATRIPRGGPNNPFAEVLSGAPARVIYPGGERSSEVQAVFDSLDAYELACAPLRSRDRVVGLLLADHRITGNRVTADSLRALEMLAAQAGFAVERAALADKLEQRVVELREAHRKIAGIQEIVARMERFSVVGEITAEVAHQIRNPLTIIGGWARNLLSSKKPEDREYRGLSVICRQADRISELLRRVISVEGWQGRAHQTFELEPILRQSLEVLETKFSTQRVSWHFDAKLDGYLLTGRPDALRFALFEVFSGMPEHLDAGTRVTVRAWQTPGGAQVGIWPQGADINNTGAERVVTGFFEGHWGTGPAQRNLALEYLTEHHAALAMDRADGRLGLVIDFEHGRREQNEDSSDRR